MDKSREGKMISNTIKMGPDFLKLHSEYKVDKSG